MGNSLFGDFSMMIGFDNDPLAEVKPATVVSWLCRHCERGEWSAPSEAFAAMVEHARSHFPVGEMARSMQPDPAA